MNAKEIATLAHQGQFRRDGVTPYIEHPKEVASFFGDDQPLLQQVAWLHDVIEDTSVTAQNLFDWGIDGDVIHAVQLLSHNDNRPYDEYIKSLFDSDDISYMLARRVKLADIITNLSDSPTERQKEKYGQALRIFMYKMA